LSPKTGHRISCHEGETSTIADQDLLTHTAILESLAPRVKVTRRLILN